MPIFEYKCIDCGLEFEKLVIRSNQVISCPDCQGQKLKKLISAFAFKSGSHFSGSSGNCGSCATRNCGSCGR
ncbi:MAG: zinc ribbon domain-containing protein [bacterium]